MTQPTDTSLHLLATEQMRPELSNLDQLAVEEMIDLMCADVQRVPDAITASKDSISRAVADITERMERGGRLIYAGAGTAGRLGLLDAAETGPTFNVTEGQIVGVLAGGTSAFGTPIENAEDDSSAGSQAMRELSLSADDIVVGISASGRTPYAMGALQLAKERGALTVCVVCNPGTPMSQISDDAIEVEVGPELIAGSTRMNSGTAQKIVLNIISTAVMVRLGKTYGNLMVDLRPTNEKLRDRATRIVAQITGATYDESLAALEQGSWRPQVAATMLVAGLSAEQAANELTRHAGRLRQTLDALRTSAATTRSRTGGWTRLGVAAALVHGVLVPGDVAVHHGRIEAVGLSNPGIGIAVPGFIDAQVNGFAGVDILNAEVDALVEMGIALRRDGIIAYQPTLITSDLADVERAIVKIIEAKRANRAGASILGIHLEGPFLSAERAGTHPVNHLKAPDRKMMERLLASGQISMVTIAPELPGALELIELCAKRDIVVSLGHSAATASQAEAGFDCGATAVTHLFNAMPAISARAPGIAGAALSRGDVTLQFIADGVHVADELLLLAFAAASQRCTLVSDMIAAAGCGETTVQLGEVTVHVEEGVAKRADGTIAGSIGKLRDSVTRLARLGVPAQDVLNAVTWNPARLLRATNVVALEPGSTSDVLILDEQLGIARWVIDEHDGPRPE